LRKFAASIETGGMPIHPKTFKLLVELAIVRFKISLPA
jgi:hypothetical protein